MVPATPEDLPPELRAGWEALRLRFLAGLPERWRVIASAPDAAARVTALHRLAGVAGSYGCEELGRLARRAEALAGDQASPALDQALAELERMLTETAQRAI